MPNEKPPTRNVGRKYSITREHVKMTLRGQTRSKITQVVNANRHMNTTAVCPEPISMELEPTVD